ASFGAPAWVRAAPANSDVSAHVSPRRCATPPEVHSHLPPGAMLRFVALPKARSRRGRRQFSLRAVRFVPRIVESVRLPMRFVARGLRVRIPATPVRAPRTAVRVPVPKFSRLMRFAWLALPDVRRLPFPVPSSPRGLGFGLHPPL